ncbi:hypothetical protein DY000_02047891 [Brassica cretica]|uniref:Uncharacterized protein n=1 Tax=Brassica cretica TaxID=69181 RepID=A0ABQ7EQ74_BRACR|nr:hypothetical protein DY000_02047891 [Brassica cretica]
MVATLVLVRDENGDLYDQEGHLRNAAGHRLDDQRAIILDHDADAAAADAQAIGDEAQAARPRTHSGCSGRLFCADDGDEAGVKSAEEWLLRVLPPILQQTLMLHQRVRDNVDPFLSGPFAHICT